MKEVELKSIQHWHVLIEEYMLNYNKFRGHSNSSWKLIPKAGRPEYSEQDDQLIFKHWKRRAKLYLKNEHFSDLELLSIAQHTGLPTRLLDWSHNPLVALFFCCFENMDKDGSVFIFPPENYILDENCDPYNIKSEVLFYQPTTSNERLANQYGYFSVHKNPKKEFHMHSESGELEKIIIPRRFKGDLINMLNHYGVNYLTLLPDLEGLSKHLSWFYQKDLASNFIKYV